MTTYNRYDSITINAGPVGEGMLLRGATNAEATVQASDSWRLIVPNGNIYSMQQDPAGTQTTFSLVTLTNNATTSGFEELAITNSATTINVTNTGVTFTAVQTFSTAKAPLITINLPVNTGHLINADTIIENLATSAVQARSEIAVYIEDLTASYSGPVTIVTITPAATPNTLDFTRTSGTGLGPFTYTLDGVNPFPGTNIRFTIRAKLIPC